MDLLAMCAYHHHELGMTFAEEQWQFCERTRLKLQKSLINGSSNEASAGHRKKPSGQLVTAQRTTRHFGRNLVAAVLIGRYSAFACLLRMAVG